MRVRVINVETGFVETFGNKEMAQEYAELYCERHPEYESVEDREGDFALVRVEE